MKVCPTCQSRYDQGEQFCPSDGTELVDARELSPGELTDKELDGVVHLDELVRSDPLGERYDGSLVGDDRSVRVTVFNQAATVREGREEDVEPIVDLFADPVPAEILAVHSVHTGETDYDYVVEEPAGGPDLRSLLDERESLDWRRAARITAHLAQALHWMGERGHVHRGLYPGAIHLRDPEANAVRVGGWVQSVLTYHADPLAGAGNGESFVGFAPYLSPEALRDDANEDERSLVYSLGMIFYEMVLGKPPFASGGTEETLKRHLHEKPLKLSIAATDEDLNPEIDDVLAMMWAKDPTQRFQTPKATIAALAGLVDEEPQDLAPIPNEAESPVFAKAEAEDEEESDAESASKETLIGLGGPDSEPAVDGSEADEEPVEPTGDEDSTPPVPEKDEASAETEPNVGASISGSVEVPSDEVREGGDQSSEVKTGEAAIDAAARERTPSSENPSIIIEDPELETAMSSGGDSEGETEGTEKETAPDMSSWADALEGSARAPSNDALVTGFVDAETGMQHSPDGEAVPVSVKARDLTDDPGRAETSPGASDAGSDDSGPVVEINPDAQRDKGSHVEEDPTQVGPEVKKEIEEAKRQLREEVEKEKRQADETSSENTAPPPGAETGPPGNRAPAVPPEAAGPPDRDSQAGGPPNRRGPDDEPPSNEAPPGEAPAETEESIGTPDQAPAETQESVSTPGEESVAETDESIDEEEIVVLDESAERDSPSDAPGPAGEPGPPTIPDDADDEPEEPQPEEPAETQPSTDTPSRPSPPETASTPSSTDRDDQAAEKTDVTDEWFEVTDEEAWMAADVREERDRSEMIRRYATWGFLILLLTTALGLIIFSQTYNPSEKSPEQKAEETTDE